MNRRILALILLVAVLLTACGKKKAEGPEGRKAANELAVGIAQDLDDSLDPHVAVKAGTREVMFNVFEGLVKPTSEGDLVPAVAEDWSLSEDRLTYSFRLRDGVKFHNGDAVTADDVVWSISRCAGLETGEPLIEALASVRAVEKKDTRTVDITIDQPNGEFLSYMTAAILPAGYDKQDTAPVGTGPFRYVSRTAQDSVVLEKFKDYWGTPAYLDKVTFKIIENADSIVMSLQSGAVDCFSHLTTTQISQLNDDFNVEEGTMNLVQALYLNNAVAPFDDVRVRQALCYAVDRQGILDLAFDGYGSLIGSSMYPAFGKYFDASLTDYYSHDVAKAKALLAEAGYPDGISMTITAPSNYKPHMDTAQVLVQQLAEAGITATIEPIEWESWISDVYVGRNFQSTVVGVDASNMTARALLERFQSDAGNNFINYSNEEYDDLFARALETTDDAEQTSLYKEMEKNLTVNAANVYIQDMADMVAVRKGITGIQFYPIYVQDYSQVRYQ